MRSELIPGWRKPRRFTKGPIRVLKGDLGLTPSVPCSLARTKKPLTEL